MRGFLTFEHAQDLRVDEVFDLRSAQRILREEMRLDVRLTFKIGSGPVTFPGAGTWMSIPARFEDRGRSFAWSLLCAGTDTPVPTSARARPSQNLL